MSAADEWAIVAKHICPPRSWPRAVRCGNAREQTVGWFVVDETGARITEQSFGMCADAERYIETMKVAGDG